MRSCRAVYRLERCDPSSNSTAKCFKGNTQAAAARGGKPPRE